jgi:4'-phosphopantetheinyl transferase EntD
MVTPPTPHLGEGGRPQPHAELATLAHLLAGWPVIVEEMRDAAEIPPLHPAEAVQIADAAPQRQREFAQARACARRALARMNVHDFALLNGDDRAPRWPAGILGSITHTARPALTYAGIAVGPSADIMAVGIDAEAARGLDVALQRRVLTVDEQSALTAAPSDRRPLLAKIIFSAKEAFYKAQFSLSRKGLSFHDVDVALDIERSTFEARLNQRAPTGLPLVRCQGRYVTDAKLVLTGVVILRSEAAAARSSALVFP